MQNTTVIKFKRDKETGRFTDLSYEVPKSYIKTLSERVDYLQERFFRLMVFYFITGVITGIVVGLLI